MRAEKCGEGWGGGWETALAREVSARHPDFALIDVRAGIGVRLGSAWRGPWGGWAVRGEGHGLRTKLGHRWHELYDRAPGDDLVGWRWIVVVAVHALEELVEAGARWRGWRGVLGYRRQSSAATKHPEANLLHQQGQCCMGTWLPLYLCEVVHHRIPDPRPPTSWDKSGAAHYVQKTLGGFGHFWPLRAEGRRSLALRQ